MGKLSIGGGLVVRQALFVGLVLAFGVTAVVAAHTVRDQASALAQADPRQMAHMAVVVASSADKLFYNLLIGTCIAAFLILGVSMPIMHRTLALPFRRLAGQMGELAAGNTAVQITDAQRADEIGVIARGLMVVRDAVKRNNDLMAELAGQEDSLQHLRQRRFPWQGWPRVRFPHPQQIGRAHV